MKRIIFPASFFIFSFCFFTLTATAQKAEENIFRNLEVISFLSRPPQVAQTPRSSNIKDIQVFGENSGIASTADALFRTADNGENWREIALPKSFREKISAAFFKDENVGFIILADSQNVRLRLLTTNDGGNSWTKTPINLRNEDLPEADLENVKLEIRSLDNFILTFRVPTSSNFVGQIIYQSPNGGESWEFSGRSAEIRRDDEASAERQSGNWTLKTEGTCEGAKIGCVQETKIFAGTKEITPSPIKELSRIEKETAATEARNSVFSSPPNGATRISLNRGFDKCTAAPVSQMQAWWNNSPFYDSNIYISGRNRGCSQALLTASWVNSVSAMGWGLIPTIVGYQAPCSVSTNSAKHSSDTGVAETQGRGEADIAITDANNLGLTQGTVLYYDMERYDETVNTPGCRLSVNAFLKGWTDRLHEQGYISGVYGSPFNANGDWINIPAASRMDAVWLARWNNIMSVWGVAPLPDNYWTNHQRIHQWLGPRNETWGGVTFNIDNNISDAPVAGLAIAKNKPADFDGDGKSDVSVFRAETNSWYVLNSSNSTFSAIAFGSGSDILAPGDYDGDGKTDTAVFRPADGNWYFRTKAGFFNSRTFGASGDIPVPADFNGDGKTDIAVFRPSNGFWYIANSDSLGTYNFVQFGQSGDKPVQSDYDGDGKSDIAVFRPSTGSWYVLRSSDRTFSGVNFGASTDQPTQGDFDGDNKTDVAVFRSGTWYLLQTTAGFSAVNFGTTGDVPAVGDFDGDNKSDVAVYRPSNGVWYILQSQNGFTAAAFGNSTDKPIPNAYLPQ
ncbi:MAG: DUF1906 domain-containing protein [Pyrinomonadaceae bacterium]|nr:DUF1906 domain-containing protein [Pyrinomonadaceae bacterium]